MKYLRIFTAFFLIFGLVGISSGCATSGVTTSMTVIDDYDESVSVYEETHYSNGSQIYEYSEVSSEPLSTVEVHSIIIQE